MCLMPAISSLFGFLLPCFLPLSPVIIYWLSSLSFIHSFVLFHEYSSCLYPLTSVVTCLSWRFVRLFELQGVAGYGVDQWDFYWSLR